MEAGRIVFAHLMDYLPTYEFNRCVQRYRGDHRLRSFSCKDQFLTMAFAQLTYRESLRDIETCLRAVRAKLYHAGFRSHVARNTLAQANENRDWRMYADLASVLIARARALYADEPLAVDLDNAVYAFDSTTIDLCLSLFPWAQFRRRKSAVKLHTLLDLRGNIPCFVHVSSGRVSDVKVLDLLPLEAGAFYVMDRGYIDFRRLYAFTEAAAFFVIRGKRGLDYERRERRPVDKSSGLRSDSTIVLTGPKTSRLYPQPLRRISYYAADIDKRFVFLTNNLTLPALTIALLYKCRWQVELFFRWIKQHLRIKAFYGTSPNAVRTQIWIAIAVYVLVAIIKKRLQLEVSLYTILQILSVTTFEQVPISQVLTNFDYGSTESDSCKQLLLLDL